MRHRRSPALRWHRSCTKTVLHAADLTASPQLPAPPTTQEPLRQRCAPRALPTRAYNPAVRTALHQRCRPYRKVCPTGSPAPVLGSGLGVCAEGYAEGRDTLKWQAGLRCCTGWASAGGPAWSFRFCTPLCVFCCRRMRQPAHRLFGLGAHAHMICQLWNRDSLKPPLPHRPATQTAPAGIEGAWQALTGGRHTETFQRSCVPAASV